MPYLRFVIKFGDWIENEIQASIARVEDKPCPFVENDLVTMPLQFGPIEVGPGVYEEVISEATWITELFPDGEYVEIKGAMLAKVTRVNDNETYTLSFQIDKDNQIVAHLTEQDRPDFPFTQNDKVTMQFRVSRIDYDDYIKEWLTWFAPAGDIKKNTIISEVKRIGKEM